MTAPAAGTEIDRLLEQFSWLHRGDDPSCLTCEGKRPDGWTYTVAWWPTDDCWSVNRSRMVAGRFDFETWTPEFDWTRGVLIQICYAYVVYLLTLNN